MKKHELQASKAPKEKISLSNIAKSSQNSDKPREECGVYGIFNSPDASLYTYLGLYSLQHRGQESAGISSTDSKHLYRYANLGQVSQVFDKSKILELKGTAAIGHNRYSTKGATFLRNAQPIRIESKFGAFSLAHNGNLVNSWTLRKELENSGSIFQTTADSEVIVHLMSKNHAATFIESLIHALQKVKGAYSLVLLTKDALYAVRDPNGFRPLVLGTKNNEQSFAVASETCAFDITNIEYLRDVKAGEIVRIDKEGISSFRIFEEKRKETLCIFENIYFSRPDSTVFGSSVYEVRKNLGRTIARKYPIKADLVAPVPDSSVSAALGYSEESGIPYDTALIRSHYIGRTFIEPDQKIRDFGAKLKYSVIPYVVKSKRIILIDDSIMRGTTARKLVKIIKKAGAKEIYLCIAAPPTKYPCYYGIDIPTKEELLAHNNTIKEMTKILGVDGLFYIDIEDTINSMDTKEDKTKQERKSWCTACFSGDYPIPLNNLLEQKNQKDLFNEYFIEEKSASKEPITF